MYDRKIVVITSDDTYPRIPAKGQPTRELTATEKMAN